ncbi:MAG TPA: DUF2530 domain-containing protein [Mycobacteriales bacterium]|nr:DUF2530 domain-containing protein [Mycobacteriales bacterium]
MSLLAKSGVPRRPDPPPLEHDDVRVVTIGTLLWAAALTVLVLLKILGVGGVRDWWLAMCASGVLLGLIGVVYCRRRRERLLQPEN